VTGDTLAGDFFAADPWLGRLPVKTSVADLFAVGRPLTKIQINAGKALYLPIIRR
jgi:hypothetical protein